MRALYVCTQVHNEPLVILDTSRVLRADAMRSEKSLAPSHAPTAERRNWACFLFRATLGPNSNLTEAMCATILRHCGYALIF